MILGITAQQAAMNAAPAGSGIQFVGGFVGSAVGGGYAFDFSSLSGGLATSPSVGDFFLIVGGWARNGASAPTLGTVPVGCDPTSIAAATGSDSIDSGIRVYKGFYEEGSATGGVMNSPGGSSTCLVVLYVFRGVDAVTPLDATPTVSGRSGGCDITLASITPVTPGAVIVGAAVSGSQSSAAVYNDPAGFNSVFKVGRATTYDGSIIVCKHDDWVSGAFAPGVFDFAGGDSLSSACSATIALRPAA